MPALGPPEALSPRDWNALVDYDKWNDFYTPDTGVVLHHGGGADYPAGNAPFSVADEIQQLQQWEGYHLFSKGWRGLAYGWGVGQSGTIYRIRGWNSYGAHRGDHDGDGVSNNEELIPIIWVASGNHHEVSQAAQDAVSRLRHWMLESAPRATWLYGHREVSTTTCPGRNGMAYVTANRELEDVMTPEQEKKLDDVLSILRKPMGSDDGPNSREAWFTAYQAAKESRRLSDADAEVVADRVVAKLNLVQKT